jgi:hypothetical protein
LVGDFVGEGVGSLVREVGAGATHR